MRETGYNRAAAVAYARQWAFARNPRYYNFDSVGGDCTNFASQCVFAGAGVMNTTPTMGWYYRSSSDRTPSWTGVEYLYRFLINNRSIGPYAREVGAGEVQVGDLVQLGRSDGSFYHTPVITATSPAILVAAHTFDAFDRPLSTYSFDKVRFLHIDGVRVWS
ncbi:MAG: amidase domain-containing protein [Clostridia bacterium]|nr:amidase domain-containing protein [Clostridia bacterium]